MQINIECKSCGATGIYHGFAEGDGVGVICNICKGTGGVLFNYNSFRSKKLRKDIEIVFKTATLYKLEKKSEGGNCNDNNYRNAYHYRSFFISFVGFFRTKTGHSIKSGRSHRYILLHLLSRWHLYPESKI